VSELAGWPQKGPGLKCNPRPGGERRGTRTKSNRMPARLTNLSRVTQGQAGDSCLRCRPLVMLQGALSSLPGSGWGRQLLGERNTWGQRGQDSG
jgi:hypothetical protein